MPSLARGFTLVELMIVVAIIGILAVVAIPNFQSFQSKARRAEAVTALNAMMKMAEAYNAEYDTYFTTHDRLGWEVPQNSRYNYAYDANLDDWQWAGTQAESACLPSVAGADLELEYFTASFGDTATKCGIHAIAMGNIDSDDTCDFVVAGRTNPASVDPDCGDGYDFLPMVALDDVNNEFLMGEE